MKTDHGNRKDTHTFQLSRDQPDQNTDVLNHVERKSDHLTNLLNMAVPWGKDFARPPYIGQSTMDSSMEFTAPTGLSS